MRKLSIALCILSFVFMLSACSTESSITTNSDTTENKTTAGITTTEQEEHYYTIEDPSVMNVSEVTFSETQPESKTKLVLGEPVAVGNLTFTLNGISEFVDQYSPDDITFYDVPNAENYSFILVYFTIENKGDTAINPSCINMSIISDGEREHSVNRVWYYDADCINLDSSETGAWVGTSPKLEAEDGVREGITVFQLSDNILESDVSLELVVEINDNYFTYTIR